MAQNVVINGVTYPSVPSVNIPMNGGGTAVFLDTSDGTATAAEVMSGKPFYAGGERRVGTLTTPTITQNAETKVLSIT